MFFGEAVNVNHIVAEVIKLRNKRDPGCFRPIYEESFQTYRDGLTYFTTTIEESLGIKPRIVSGPKVQSLGITNAYYDFLNGNLIIEQDLEALTGKEIGNFDDFMRNLEKSLTYSNV